MALSDDLTNLAGDARALEAELAELKATPAPPAPPTPVKPGTAVGVILDTFPGATDDDKLDAAYAYALAQTVSPPVQLLDREYQFRRPQQLVNGKKLVGGQAVATQQRSAGSHSNLIRVNIPDGGAWFRMPDTSGSEVWDFELSRLSLIGAATTDLVSGGRGVMWTSNIHDIAAVNFRHILGSPSAKLLLTACNFGGAWNINNSRGRAVTIGGSDNSLWMSGRALFDSPTNLSGSTDAHVCLDYMSKSQVGGLYITAEGGPAALLINGGASSFGMTYWGLTLEGRNAGAPSKGSVLRINGGTNVFYGLNTNYAGASFGATPRKNEQGIIGVFGGTTVLNDPQYARATGVAEAVPFVHANAAATRVRVNGALGVGHGWAGKPTVRTESGATIDADSSITA